MSRASTGTCSSCRCSFWILRAAARDTAAAEAIEYAVNHGAKVINASWGGSGTDSIIAAAIEYADQHGVIIVAAAGNNGTDDDNSSTFFSPASYSVDYPNVISVAATDSNGDAGIVLQLRHRPRCNWLPPAMNVYGVESNGTYGYDSGTSMAAPLVTGTIALVEAAHPSWSMSQVIDAVLDTTTPDPNLVGQGDHRRHRQCGRGRRQHRRALCRLGDSRWVGQ